ncbi:MAG: PD-(D/E)XK nuclease family protein [Endomicrobium sp.]|jgi:CRISPR/Cas system-associated exonuclease Cas4 (RecB family)|nr:PD-(D/E)XK nuclease family protein [Endomicrobium sp.]
MIKKYKYTNILGWSLSRYNRFISCKRRYFYDYYAKYDVCISKEKIFFLKNLTSKNLEIGNIVHIIIKDILKRYQKSSKTINKDKFLRYIFNLVKDYYNSKFFFENYYKTENIIFSDIYEKSIFIIKNFLNSTKFKWIIEKAILYKDKWIIEPEDFGETRIDNYKAFCKVDFLVPFSNKLYILDWKTGKPKKEDHLKQLISYSLWAIQNFNVNTESIVPLISYLYPYYFEKNIKINIELINKFKRNIKKETKDMYKYLIDIEKNIPKNKEEFPTSNNVYICKYCNYKEIC